MPPKPPPPPRKDTFDTFTEESSSSEEFVPLETVVSITSYHRFWSYPHHGFYNRNIKETDSSLMDRKFDKKKSVFKDWQIEKPKRMQAGFLDETRFWKVPNFVKDQQEVQDIEQYFL